MLSVTTKFSSVKGCFRVFPIRRLCSATSKPRKRKNVAGSRITSEALPHNAQAGSPPDTVKSLAVGKKLLNTAESVLAASNMESTSVPSKKLPLRVTKKMPSKASPTMSSAELSSILSLDEPEQVSSHPTLKFIDFSIPTEEVDFSNVVNPSRYLSALRLCHKFSHGCALIRLHLATLNGPAVLEAARLLAAAQLRHRCALHSQPSENTYMHDVEVLSHELSKRFKSTSLPQSMAVAVNILLGCVMDPSRTVSEISVEEMKQMIFRSEVHHHLACAALDCNQWEKFKCIMSSGSLSPHYSPILVFHMINFVLRNTDLQKEVLKWYLDALSIEHKPLNQLQWSTYAANMIRVCGMKSVTAAVTRKGIIGFGDGKDQQLSLPKEEPFSQADFSCLKSDLNTLLGQLSKGSGSVTRKEVFALRKSVNSWSKRYDDRAIVIDSLNVFHGRTTAFESLVKLTNRLTSEYDNAVLVTRPFLAEKLKFIRWRGNVHVFSCSTLSEDDLLVLLAAVEWGPNAYVLSNDRFNAHVERANCTGRLSLEEWMRRRMIRFDKHNWQYDALPEYGEFVQQVNSNTYFVPISEDTPGIPLRSARLVTL